MHQETGTEGDSTPSTVASRPRPEAETAPFQFDHKEMAGAVADLGVLVPIAVALIVTNGLSATAVLVPAGLLYLASGWLYRLPIPVQPLKAFGAIAIAHGLGVDEIAAGALLMGVTFLLLGATGLIDRAAKIFPRPIIRGVQLCVGLLFIKLAWGLVTDPPSTFTDHVQPTWWLVVGGLVVAAAALLLRRRAITLGLLAVAVTAMALGFDGTLTLGPSPTAVPAFSADAFITAAVVLVVPQLPLTFANSCLATADAARSYFGPAARRVRPGRLAMSLGAANLLTGIIGGMPVCHGAGGLTAHRSFGARTGGAPLAIGTAMVLLGLLLGAALPTALSSFPIPVLAGLLAVAGLLHVTLLQDLRHPLHWALAISVGIAGVIFNLAVALLGALVIWWAAKALTRLHPDPR